jgi:hypothetical protein
VDEAGHHKVREQVNVQIDDPRWKEEKEEEGEENGEEEIEH